METFVQHITTALGWSIIHSLWQGALLYSILCMIYSVWPKSKAKYRYNLAYTAQALMLILFSGTLLYYCEGLLPSSSTLSTDTVFFRPAEMFSSESRWTTIERMLPWFSSVYVLGLLLQLIFFGNSFSKLRQLRRSGLSEVPVEWLITFKKLYQKLHIPKSTAFHLSDKVSSPLTLGYFKPMILFPVAYANQMDIKQVESVLLHELAHIKRNDYLLNLIKVGIETTLFFNPFVWLLSKHIDTEREHACDDMVIKLIPSPIVYAQALLSIEESKCSSPNSYALSITGQKQHLLHRIQRITKMEKHYINVKQHLIAIGVSTLALGALAWTVPAETDQNTVITQKENMGLSPELIETDLTTFAPLVHQTDTTKRKKQVIIVNKDTIIAPVEQAQPTDVQELKKYYNSPEWKNHVAKIEENAKKVEEYYNSPEWKNHVAKIEENAKKVEEYYNSPEWKNHIAKIEENAKKVEEYYNSPEWRNHVAKIEENAKKVEKYYNSPEWKNHIAKIEENAKKVEKYYNSPEWKNHIAKIEENAKRIEEYYNSSGWKQKVADIEENVRKAVEKDIERNK